MNGIKSIIHIVDYLADLHPEKVAYKYYSSKGQVILTYKELKDKAIKIASYLQSFDTYKKPVMVLLPPSLEYNIAIFGCLYAGVIPVPAYPPKRNHNNQRLSNIIQNVEGNYILTNKIKGQFCPPVNHKLYIEDAIEYEGAYQNIKVSLSDICFIQYTSGTTSLPKGVMINHENLFSNLKIIFDYLNYQDQQQVVIGSWLPPYHDMGLVAGIFLPIYMHCPGILTSPGQFLQSPFKWLKIIEQEKITLTCSPNFAFDYCVDKITPEQIKTLNLKSWIHIFNGAEPVRYKTLKKFYDAFKECNLEINSILTGYGLAETTLMATGSKNGKWQEPLYVDLIKLQNNIVELSTDKINSVALVSSGTAFPGHKLVIVNPDTLQSVNDLEIGEIWLSGPSISSGYWKNEFKSHEVFAAQLINVDVKFLRTGDLGFIYKNHLYVTGRCTDLIILKGLNFYSHDIEYTVMNAHYSLKQYGGVVFTITENSEEKLIVLQEVSREYINKISVQEIITAIREAIFKEQGLQVSAIHLLKPNNILKTSSGKIQRRACCDVYLKNGFEVIHSWGFSSINEELNNTPCNDEHNNIMAWLSSWFINRIAKSNNINDESNLVELGIDSVIAAELSVDLSKNFNKAIDMIDVMECQKLKDLMGLITATNYIPPVTTSSKNLVPESPLPYEKQLKKIYTQETSGIAGATLYLENQEYINFSSYNYLGASGDPYVTEMAIKAINEYGTSVSASRLASGEKILHSKLENSISTLIGTERCLVYSSGHATNISVITQLFGEGDLIVYDIYCHNSIAQGIKFSGAKSISFPHNDYQALEKILMSQSIQFNKVLIVTEGIFSMDGDIPDVRKLVELKKKYNTFLMIDEAHSIGTLGKTGAGIREYFDIKADDIDIWMGTLSKSFGSCGGYIAGSAKLIDHLQFHAGGFVYSAGITPANTAAAYASIELMLKQPERIERLHRNHKYLLSLLTEKNIPTGLSYDSPIIPIIMQDELATLDLANHLKKNKIFVIPIIYPAVPKNASRIRMFISSLHTLDQLNYAADVIINYLKQLAVGSSL